MDGIERVLPLGLGKVYIRGKMDAQDMILDDITRKKTYLVWSCQENGPNASTKNYDSLET